MDLLLDKFRSKVIIEGIQWKLIMLGLIEMNFSKDKLDVVLVCLNNCKNLYIL